MKCLEVGMHTHTHTHTHTHKAYILARGDSTLMLTQCGTESARTDSFLDIPLVIKPFGSDIAYQSIVSSDWIISL